MVVVLGGYRNAFSVSLFRPPVSRQQFVDGRGEDEKGSVQAGPVRDLGE
jgi:hypothetical protein